MALRLALRKIKQMFCNSRTSDFIAYDAILSKIRRYTMLDDARLKNLYHLAIQIKKRHIDGDFVECGVCNGGSAALLGAQLNEARQLWLYDSFEGMPGVQVHFDGEDARKEVGTCSGAEDLVEKALHEVGVSNNRYTICTGMFEETFKDSAALPKKVALLHCDADWYESVSAVLDTFYPLLSEGGIVVLDDFGHWEGCREAFYDFCSKFDEKPVLERCGYSQAYWVKGKLNNRY